MVLDRLLLLIFHLRESRVKYKLRLENAIVALLQIIIHVSDHKL